LQSNGAYQRRQFGADPAGQERPYGLVSGGKNGSCAGDATNVVNPDLCVITPRRPEGNELTSLSTWRADPGAGGVCGRAACGGRRAADGGRAARAPRRTRDGILTPRRLASMPDYRVIPSIDELLQPDTAESQVFERVVVRRRR
jgi:hypothetical protein